MTHKKKPARLGAGAGQGLTRAKRAQFSDWQGAAGIAEGAVLPSVLAAARLVDLRAALRHGNDPCTRAQAAAHEAGHVIIGAALGRVLDKAWIKRADGLRGAERWHGMTQPVVPDEGPLTITARTHPMRTFAVALGNLAGGMGEALAGVEHPAASAVEPMMAAILCAQLDGVWGKPEGWTWVVAAGCVCPALLAANREAFDAVRRHLLRFDRVTRNDGVRLLADVRRVDVAELLREANDGVPLSALPETPAEATA